MDEKRIEVFDGPRGCEEYEIGAVTDLANYVFEKAYGSLNWYGHIYAFVFNRKNRENVRIIKMDNRIASSASMLYSTVCFNARELKVAGLSTVMTHPDNVGKGYNSMLINDCINKMERDGMDISIVTTTIQNYYRKFGWENAGAENEYFVDAGNVSLLPELGECRMIRCRADEHLEPVKKLYYGSGIGAKRDREDFLLKIFNKPNMEVYAAESAGEICGYIVLSRDRVIEHIGKASITAGLVKQLFLQKLEQQGRIKSTDPKSQFSLRICCPDSEMGLGGYLNNLGYPKKTGYLCMIKVLNYSSLIKKLGLKDIEILREDEECIVLEKSGMRESVAKAEVSKLFFGPEHLKLFGQYLTLEGFYQWPADMV